MLFAFDVYLMSAVDGRARRRPMGKMRLLAGLVHGDILLLQGEV